MLVRCVVRLQRPLKFVALKRVGRVSLAIPTLQSKLPFVWYTGRISPHVDSGRLPLPHPATPVLTLRRYGYP